MRVLCIWSAAHSCCNQLHAVVRRAPNASRHTLQLPGPLSHTHLCSKLELVKSLADLVQVVVLLLRLRLQHSRLLSVPDVSQPACADPRVSVLASSARLIAVALHAAVLLLLLLHGLLVGRRHARVIARAATA